MNSCVVDVDLLTAVDDTSTPLPDKDEEGAVLRNAGGSTATNAWDASTNDRSNSKRDFMLL